MKRLKIIMRYMFLEYLDMKLSIKITKINCKEKELIQGKAKRDSNKLSAKKGLQNKTKFALDDADIESIFDIIQKEHPDL